MRRNVGLSVLVAVILLFLAGAGGLSLWRSAFKAVQQSTSGLEAGRGEVKPEVGYPAPDFTLPDIQGRTVTLSQLKGKPIFINFWATWCPPCRVEMPEIQSFFEKYKGKVEVVAVNLTSTEKSPAEVKKFLETNGYIFPVVLDTKGVAENYYLVRAIPTSYLLDDQRIIRFKYTGPLSLQLLEQALEKIKK